MSVDSTLELYTTLFGWLFYNSIWEVLVATGIVFLPFLGIVISTVIDTYKNEESEEAGNTSLRILEIEFFVAFSVIALAAVPALPFSATNLSFTPKALIGHPAQTAVTAANSNSTYGGSISFTNYPNTVDVPLFWYAVMNFTAGFNRAVMEDVPVALDLREYANELRDIRIDDPELKAELNDFYRDCYVEARSKYLSERPSSAQINTLMNTHGATDTEWVGSHIFLQVSGYYDSIRSDSVREGFVWSQLRDTEWDTGDHPTYGKPFCSEWWSSATNGLAGKVLDETDGMDLIAAAAEPGWDATQRRDAVIRAALLNSPARWTTRGYDLAYGNLTHTYSDDSWNSLNHFIDNRPMQAIAAFGLGREALSFAAYLRIFLEAAPMLQALILMGLYALLPFFILMSRYKFSILIIGATILFIVKFWTVLWFFAWWVDQNLILALYPDPGDITNVFSFDMTIKRIILNFLTGMMYIIFPFLFSVYMSFSGIHAARSLDNASTGLFAGMAGAGKMNLRMPSKRLPKK